MSANGHAFRTLETIAEDFKMSPVRVRQLRNETLNLVVRHHQDHPDQTREQFDAQSFELSTKFLNSRGTYYFAVGAARWEWPERSSFITPRLSEFLRTQNRYYRDRARAKKRKLEEDKQERPQKRQTVSGDLSPLNSSCSVF